MFTDNYIKFREMLFKATYANMVCVDGTELTGLSGGANWGLDFGAHMNHANGVSNNTGVYFGTGTTPPQKTDYKLENELDSASLSVAEPTAGVFNTLGAGKYECMGSYTVKNITDADITIAEVGYYAMIKSGNLYYKTLFERTVLASPVTIPAGQVKVITYKLTFNHAQ